VGTLVAAIIVVVAGLGLAGGGTYLLVNNTAPDKTVQFKDAPVANNTNGIVNYGTP
jgi:hypothetical protein